MTEPAQAEVPRVTPWLLRWFRGYARRYLARHFTALRVSRSGADPAAAAGRPLVVAANHPSWWDPLVCIHLGATLFAAWQGFAPIEEAALARYRFFARLGFFGIDPESRAGAARFLRIAQAILAGPERCLWITAQGRFADVRLRPLRLQPGLGHLVRRLEQVAVLPMALEYPFWDQRRPEALVHLGEPILVTEGRKRRAGAWTELFTARLERAQEELAELAMGREAGDFRTLLAGRRGISPVYDAWRRFRARLRGESFDPTHRGRRP